MNWIHIESLIAKCNKRSAAADSLRGSAVGDYAEVLKRYNGMEGFVGAAAYLILWTLDQILELNAAYNVREYAPGITLIGTDGGDTGFGIDETSHRYVAMPLVGMSRDSATDAGGSFEEFLDTIAGH
jgi:hypothetical protein